MAIGGVSGIGVLAGRRTSRRSANGVPMLRRAFLTTSCAVAVASAAFRDRPAHAAPRVRLADRAAGAKPISREERLARIARLQRLMADQGVGAMIMESGSSLDYFTGVQWRRSERTTAAVIPARGEIVIITPAFEEPSVRETLAVGGDL